MIEINKWIARGLTLRYSGGLAPDVNQILLKGIIDIEFR